MMGHDDYRYQSESMPPTPGGRRLEKIAGTPGGIETRGETIQDLGEKMASAARTLELFADGTVGRGDSFTSIRDQAKEVHADLSTAASRYRPSGQALVWYAAALGEVQSSTDALVDNAAAAWAEVNAASRSLESAEGEVRDYERDERNDVEQLGARPSAAGEQAAFDNALETFEGYWSRYDAPVESWEAAYDRAVERLERVNDDGVSDGFWDNAMPFIEGMLFVLAIVGVILFVVALVVTGPLAAIAAAAAAIIGVISLLGELARLHTGRGSWGEVGLAIFGVLPFGKLAKVATLFDAAGDVSRFTRTMRLTFSEFIDARAGFNQIDDLLFRTRLPDAFTSHGMNTRNMFRMFLGPQAAWQTIEWTGNWGNSLRNLAGFAPGTMPTTLAEGFWGSMQAIQQFTGLGQNAKSVLAGPPPQAR